MRYKDINDYELMYYVSENDDSSYGTLFDKYLPIIKNLSYRYFKIYENFDFDYEDFFQEAVIGFQKAVNYFNEKTSTTFYTFSILCMERSLISFCRRLTSVSKNCSKELFDVVENDNLVFIDKNFEEDLINYLDIEKIYKKIIFDSLFEDGIVFELKCNGFSYYEIYILFGIPVSTSARKFNKLKDKFIQLHNLY